jgi:hypothetical protein
MRYAILSAVAFFVLFGGSVSAEIWRTPRRNTSGGPWGNPTGYNPYYYQRQANRISRSFSSRYYLPPQMYVQPQMIMMAPNTSPANTLDDQRSGAPPTIVPSTGQYEGNR